jgi:hypothetical protein
MIDILIKTIEADNRKSYYLTTVFNTTIGQYLKNMFPQLNQYDMNILKQLTLYLIEYISVRYGFEKEFAYKQWTKNNGRDCISLSLTLIPYIKNDAYDNITNLTDIIFKKNQNEATIKHSLLELDRQEALKYHFPYSNFSLGLLNNNNNNILELNNKDGVHIIYQCIENNFISMLETIKITNGKLYVNWLNIIPLVDYKKSQFYNTSINELEEMSKLMKGNIIKPLEVHNILKNNKGIYLGDYYNVLMNGYFESIKQIKWVIFCKNVNNTYYYMIQYLNKMIDLSPVLNNNDYNSMTEMEILTFNNSIKSWIYNLSNNKAIYLDIQWEFDILKNIFSFMIFNYTKLRLLDDTITSLFENIDTTLDGIDLDKVEIDINKVKISRSNVIECLSLLKPEYLWEYLKEVLNKLSSTIYGKYLINTNTIVMDFFNINSGGGYMNLKNLYNIAKNLTHNINDDDHFLIMGFNYKSLSEEHLNRFFNMYLNKEIKDWLLIPKNIEFQEGGRTFDYDKILSNIGNCWNSVKYDLVWDYLNDNGLLSTFNTSQQGADITDESTLMNVDTYMKTKTIQSKLKLYLKFNKELFNCNYFLTNKPYNMLKKFNNKSYIENLTESITSYTMYANDWISQLNFYRKYIHHNIIFITGSTGTGKSTQVPKLALYALKMYDYKMSGTAICTQPRIPPTVEVASRISFEMGVPIIEIKENDKEKYSSDLFYIQYKHSQNSHIKKYTNHLSLRLVTDGTLLEELINNPVLKVTVKTPVENNRRTNIYGIDNLYDIVMVDEAHEHNTNMDLILTLMRQACMYNNSLRLLIISATMDDDEPIYRTFYKLVNDNILYPIKQPLTLHPIFGGREIDGKTNIDDYHINSYYLDRRFHISVPKQTTLYKIEEIYNDNIELLLTDNMKENARIAQEHSYETIKLICKQSVIGDILLFSVGEAEIKEAIGELNKILPANVVAIPFYSRMNPKYRDIITDINKNIGKIRNNKLKIAEEWGENYIDSKYMPEGSYKRAVIVATNVAEASLTIDTLKYVVDTGFEKVSRYDVNLDTDKMELERISESSRIQRRGRIGRVSDGIVYYMYGKNKRLDILPKYKITMNYIYHGFLKLATKYTDNSYLIEGDMNPYSYKIFIEKFPKSLRNSQYIETTNVYKFNLFQIFKEQYLIYDLPFPLEYFYPFNELIQTEGIPNYLNRLEDGFHASQLMDLNGKFYIIHPYETLLTRNIMGDIIKLNNKLIDVIDIELYKSMLTNTNFKLYYLPFNTDVINVKNTIYKKTVYFEKIDEIMGLTLSSEADATILLLSSSYNLLYEGCMLVSMLKTINGNIGNLMDDVDLKKSYDNIRDIFGSDSDITSLYNICQLLKTKFSNMYVYTIYNNKSVLDTFKREYMTIYKEYKKQNFNQIKDSLNLMNSLYYNGKLDSDKGFLLWIKSSGKFKKMLLDDIMKYNLNIELFCKQYNLKYSTIRIYYNNLIDLLIPIISADADYEMDYDMINPFMWSKKLNSTMLKIVSKNTIEEKLNICAFLSNPLFFSVMFIEGYKNMSNIVCKIKPFIKGTLNTLCTNIGSYIGYYNYNAYDNTMSIIYNININKLSTYYPFFYNPSNIKNIYIKKDNNIIDIIQFNSNEWNSLIMNINNSFSKLSYERFPLNNMELPIIQEYIKYK